MPKLPISIRICKNVGASMGYCRGKQETFVGSTEDKDRKLCGWIACCGCGKAQNLFENIYKMEAKPTKIVYFSRCPLCDYEHKIEVMKG